MVNIYTRQMNKLGLDTRQYAELLGVPHGVINNLIKNKGGYDMELTKYLRENLFNKREELEKDMDNTKIKALEIKNSDKEYLDWYNNEYDMKAMFDRLKIKSIKEFRDKYNILIKGEKASRWYYAIVLSNKEYEDHELNITKKIEFIKQLYDIYNGNENAYKNNDYKIENHISRNRKKAFDNKENNKYIIWKKNFDFKGFMEKHNLTRDIICRELNIGISTFYNILSKTNTDSIKSTMALYEYFNNIETISLVSQDNTAEEIEIIDVIEEPKKDTIEEEIEPIEVKEDNTLLQQNEMLRNLLKERLTQQEQYLIELFGGKIN